MVRGYFVLLVSPLFLLSAFAFSEELPAVNEPGAIPITRDISTRAINIKDDMRELAEYILHPDKIAAGKMLAAGAGTAFLMLVDEDIRDEVKERSGRTLDAMERLFEPMGRWEVQGVAGGAVLGIGYIVKDRKIIDASLTGFEAYAISGGLVEIVKLISGRERPHTEKGKDAFFEGGASFPSGHTARSFAWASVISEYYHDKKMVPPISYGLAAIVSLSRIESDSHWASDVFFGACLGFGVGKALSHLHLSSRDMAFIISPYVSRDTVGFSSIVRF